MSLDEILNEIDRNMSPEHKAQVHENWERYKSVVTKLYDSRDRYEISYKCLWSDVAQIARKYLVPPKGYIWDTKRLRYVGR